MKRLVFAAMLIAGCGGPQSPPPPSVTSTQRPLPPPEVARQPETSVFDSEAEEFAYLMSLSNPTPEQWKRRNELGRKAERAAAARAVRAAEAQAKADAELKARQIAGLLADAQKHRREGKPNAAVVKLRLIVEKFPDASEAERAVTLIEECKAEARAMYEAEKAQGPK